MADQYHRPTFFSQTNMPSLARPFNALEGSLNERRPKKVMGYLCA